MEKKSKLSAKDLQKISGGAYIARRKVDEGDLKYYLYYILTNYNEIIAYTISMNQAQEICKSYNERSDGSFDEEILDLNCTLTKPPKKKSSLSIEENFD